MVRASAARRLTVALACGLLFLSGAKAARAFEYLDGRIQVHGYFEETVRAISANFNESTDLTQWYNILALEIDIDIAKDGWGPFDSIGAFIRAEVRYDCVWTRACGISPSVDVFGNRSEHVPNRLSQAKTANLSGTTVYAPPRYLAPGGSIRTVDVFPPNTNTNSAANSPFQPNAPLAPGGQRLGTLRQFYRGVDEASPYGALLDTRVAFGLGPLDATGARTAPFIDYIPGRYTFQKYLNYGLVLRDVRGGSNGIGVQTMPWDPKDGIDPFATLRDRVNPFSTIERNPIIGTITPNNAALPFRPAPFHLAGTGPSNQAAGLFIPSQPYARYIKDGGTDGFDQNFSQDSLAWNRGASQRQTKELKEAYLELETLEGKLFLRLGRQTIVWGKTELFATTDLFNAQDLALGSLTSLEESRIPQWAARGIYSFYEVGPLEDVRLEVAMSLDNFTPTDLGRCGEPYTPNPVCDITNGLLVHGTTGLALAGRDLPPSWWEDASGVEAGARLEFRWDRFSFAIVDFWNYTKFPYADRLTTFERNVDPSSGRPRRYGATGSCTTGNEPSCLQGNQDALRNSALNQQLYAVVCSSSIGFSSLDRSVCAQSVLTSTQLPLPGVTVTQLVSQLLAGSATAIATAVNPAFLGPDGAFSRVPLVSLSIDPGDGQPAGPFSLQGANYGANLNHNVRQTLAQVTSPQQQALLGCGPYYGTNCDGGIPGNPLGGGAPGGLDLLNAEASAITQAWMGFEGSGTQGFLATDRSRPQPGTVGFAGGPVCTRVVGKGKRRRVIMLPGCRGPSDPGYDPSVDGRVLDLSFPYGQAGIPAQGSGAAVLGPITQSNHPFTGQQWRSEMAALSWNLQMTLVAFSTQLESGMAQGDPGSDPALRFDPSNAYRTDGCSYVVPWRCSSVRAFWGVTGTQRNDVKAGGNTRFGRRDAVWAMGGDAVLAFQKRNVLGFSTDFAEDVTKTNWSTEATWVANQPFTDNDEFDGIEKTDQFNVTVSVDRPTFINFLNQSRTFFFNSQWFFSYVPDFNSGFSNNGPWNAFFTFTTQTGYFQDRLLPGMTWVYDVQSESGAALPSITYRFTESFSATFGLAFFWGRYQGKTMPINQIAPSNQAGTYSYTSWVENGLAAIRDRDEVFMRLRYTF